MLHYGICTQDDAFISFRYAANLIGGDGLVYNPGEPVEGYTNFLWTVLLAGAMAIGLNPVIASVLGGLIAALALALAGWRLATALIDRPWVGLLIPAFIAMDAGLALEGMQGLETLLYAALLAWALVLTHHELGDPNAPPRSAVLLALAALTRPEGAVVFAGIGLARLLIARKLERRLLVGLGIFAVVVGGEKSLMVKNLFSKKFLQPFNC
jgi:predicted membrane-bound dolichyl-phosphate-mannose-protein mannosyltransferase